MQADRQRVRDLRLLDAIDAFAREPFARAVREVLSRGAPSISRWCDCIDQWKRRMAGHRDRVCQPREAGETRT
jgi:hypothetical protein